MNMFNKIVLSNGAEIHHGKILVNRLNGYLKIKLNNITLLLDVNKIVFIDLAKS